MRSERRGPDDGVPKFRQQCRRGVVAVPMLRRSADHGDRIAFPSLAFALLSDDAMDQRRQEPGVLDTRRSNHMGRSTRSDRLEEPDGARELVPDQMLPVQFVELLQRPAERTPELRLMAAVLEDAIRTFCRC